MVVIFHRVDDRLQGNPIACTRREFRAYCDFFSRYFRVVSLRELLDRLRDGRDVGRMLVITFDDGYRDNFRIAAAELRERGLPACFFLTAGFIGTDARPWWDREFGVRGEWMRWDEVRALRAAGFEIGAHTRTHADLGRVSGEEAEREIVGAKEDLERELGEPVGFFSYPYGGAHQMKEENRGIARAAGYECCLSGFGGSVRPDDDLLHLRRTAATPWHLSPYQFGFELLLE